MNCNAEGSSRKSLGEKLKAVFFTHRAADAALLQDRLSPFLEFAPAEWGVFTEACNAGFAPDVVFTDVDIPSVYFPDCMRRLGFLCPRALIFALTREKDFFFQMPPNAPLPDGIFPFPPEPNLIKERIEMRLPPNHLYPDGVSPLAVKLRGELSRAAADDHPVLLLGESGCGKERAAGAIHAHSARKDGKLRAQNMSAIPPTLIDSALFGAAKGSYTGACGSSGLFEQSRGGTLFLDEIGEMDIDLQPKLLRALEEGEIYRVGGSSAIKTDFRLICATNRDLKGRVAENKFRADLYYRLDIIRIEIPPLRERPEDIPPIAASALRKSGKTLSLSALDKLAGHSWPGNIRELLNCIARTAVKSKKDKITAEDIVF